jgi:hypothetical protein
MLGKVLRIRGSSFRMVPNPTGDPWLKKTPNRRSWRMTRLMEVFQAKLKELIDEEGSEPDKQIKAIIGQWEKISHLGHPDGAKPNIFYREAVHDALDQTTAHLLSPTQAEVLSVLVTHISKVVEVLANPNSSLNAIDPANKEDALLSYYFADIRKAVIGKADSNWDDPSEEERE